MCRIHCCQIKSILWLVFCGVLAIAGATSAHAAVRQSTPTGLVGHVQVSAGRDVTTVAATRAAPSLPFRGVIGFYGDIMVGSRVVSLDAPGVSLDSISPHGLLYRSTGDSTLAHVPLGDMSNICGPGQIVARSDGVRVLHTRGYGPPYAGYLIPWGDDAYPLFVSQREVYSLRWPTTVNVRSDFQIELVYDDETRTHGVLKISKGAEQRFYAAGVPGPRFLGSAYVAQAREYYEPTVSLSGTDGEHYGYSIVPNEPACGPELAVVLSAATGEMVMCGWDVIGPVLVNLDESYPGVEDAVFPVDEPSKSSPGCEDTRTGIRANIFDISEFGQNASGDSEEGAAR